MSVPLKLRLNKVCLRPATLLKKEILAQLFSREFCEMFKDTFFTEHLWTTASACSKKHVDRFALLFLLITQESLKRTWHPKILT